MRIVITGSSGFLGTALVRALANTGHEVVAVTRRPGAGGHRVSGYEESPGGDVLVHLAEDSDRARVNAQGPAAEAGMQETIGRLLQKGYAKAVYVSSAILYGDAHETPRRVGDPLAIVDSYTRIKSSSESAVLGVGGAVARVANLYGPGMARGNVLSKILGQVPGEGDLLVYDSSPVRDFVWIEDAAAMLALLATGSARGIFNVGTGIGTSILDVARTALDCAGQGDRAVMSTQPSSRRSHLVVDIAETTRLTGWKPATTVPQGLGRMLGVEGRLCT